MCGVDEVRAEADRYSLITADRRSCHGKPSASICDKCWQEETATNIGEKSNACFWHCHYCTFGHNAMTTMYGQTQATTHGYTINDGDEGFAAFGDCEIQGVFFFEERIDRRLVVV